MGIHAKIAMNIMNRRTTKMERQYIMIGTKVNSNHGEAKVTGIELCKNGEKYGIDMPKVFVEDKDRCTFDLDNGHWAYGYQVDPINA
jgi:hypothetical protein